MSKWTGAAYGAAVSLIGSLLLVVQGDEGFAAVTVAEWLTVLAAVLSSSAVAEVFSRKAAPVELAEPGRHAAEDDA